MTGRRSEAEQRIQSLTKKVEAGAAYIRFRARDLMILKAAELPTGEAESRARLAFRVMETREKQLDQLIAEQDFSDQRSAWSSILNLGQDGGHA